MSTKDASQSAPEPEATKAEISSTEESKTKKVKRKTGARTRSAATTRATTAHVPTLVMLSLVFFAMLATAIVFGSQVMSGLEKGMQVLVIGAFALVVTVVLAGFLGATGKIEQPGYVIGGSIVVWLAVFGALFKAFVSLDSAWDLRLTIVGLPEDTVATVRVGDCSQPTEAQNGPLTLRIRPDCDEPDNLGLMITVRGYKPFEETIARTAARTTRTRVQWKADRDRLILSGTVSAKQGPVTGAKITFIGCADAEEKVSGTNGGFVIEAPLDCDSGGPYELRAELHGSVGQYKFDKPRGIDLHIAPGIEIASSTVREPGLHAVQLTQSPGAGNAFMIGDALYLPLDPASAREGYVFAQGPVPELGTTVKPGAIDLQTADAFFERWSDPADTLLIVARDTWKDLSVPRTKLCERARGRAKAQQPNVAALVQAGNACSKLNTERATIARSLAVCPSDAKLTGMQQANDRNRRRFNCS